MLVLFLLLFLNSVCSTITPCEELSNKVLTALENVLEYIYMNVNYMNLDGLLGVAFSDANLRTLPKNGKTLSYTNLTSKILQQANYSKIEINSKNKLFTKYLIKSNIWKKDINFTYNNFNRPNGFVLNSCASTDQNNELIEKLSDNCMLELIKSSQIKLDKCCVSKFCKYYITDKIYDCSLYGINHRLLFLQTSRALNCSWNQEWLRNKIKRYCWQIYQNMLVNVNLGFLRELDDLFLEQVFLCGYEGYMEFLTKALMKHVLEIQTESGCFGVYSKDNSYKTEFKRLKREANLIPDQCLDHTTGLGVAVLSLFVRALKIICT